MTKKDKILKMFNDANWIEGMGMTFKILSYENFCNNGLAPTIEYGERYCDVIYAKNILKKMGYKVLVGNAFHVIKIK